MMEYFVGADVGGTNCRFVLFHRRDDDFEIVCRKNYETSQIKSFPDAVNIFLDDCECKVRIQLGVFGVAGEVNDSFVKLTNASLKVDKREIVKKTSLKDVYLLNDTEIEAYGVSFVKEENLLIVNGGVKKEASNKCVIGVGTGLGVGMIFYDRNNKTFRVEASEGGHMDFSSQNLEERALLDFIMKKHSKNRVVYEDLLSGRGLEDIYEFFANKKLTAEEISDGDNKFRDNYANMTFQLFYKFYARFARAMALLSLPIGGIYLIGGVVSKNLSFSKDEFKREFCDNSRFKSMLEKIPIYVVKNEEIGILGLKNYILNNK